MTVEFYSQCFLVVATPVADFTLHIDVGHEIHFDAALAVAFAGFAAAACDVKAETARFVAAFARLGKHGEKVANGRKDLGVGGGIGTRRAADGRLVNTNDLVYLVFAEDAFVRAGFLARAVKALGKGGVEDVVDQRPVAAAADAGDDRHASERNANVEVLQVVLARAGHSEPIAGERARLRALQDA